MKQAYVFGLHNSNCKLDERNGNNKTVNIASHHRSDGRTDGPKWEMTTKSKTGRDKTSKHALEEDFFAFYFLLILLMMMMSTAGHGHPLLLLLIAAAFLHLSARNFRMAWRYRSPSVRCT